MQRRKKRTITTIAIAMLAALAACGNNEATNATAAPLAEATAPAAESAPVEDIAIDGRWYYMSVCVNGQTQSLPGTNYVEFYPDGTALTHNEWGESKATWSCDGKTLRTDNGTMAETFTIDRLTDKDLVLTQEIQETFMTINLKRE